MTRKQAAVTVYDVTINPAKVAEPPNELTCSAKVPEKKRESEQVRNELALMELV